MSCFAFLSEKRQLLLKMDVARLDELEPAGEQLMARLQSCHIRRGELLAQAASESRPAVNLRMLAKSLPAAERARGKPRVGSREACPVAAEPELCQLGLRATESDSSRSITGDNRDRRKV